MLSGGTLSLALSLQIVDGDREPGFVTIGRVFRQDALGDRTVNGRDCGGEQLPCDRGITCVNGAAQCSYHGAHAGALGPIDSGPLD